MPAASGLPQFVALRVGRCTVSALLASGATTSRCAHGWRDALAAACPMAGPHVLDLLLRAFCCLLLVMISAALAACLWL